MKRIGAIAAVLLVPLMLAVGCQGGKNTGTGTGPTTPPPSATTTPTGSPTTPAPTSSPTTHQPVKYPSDYHAAVLAAWANHDANRLALLTSDPQDFLAIHPDQHWTQVGTECEGAMGSRYCSDENRTGDVVIIRITAVGLAEHKWHVAELFRWDPMSYPNDPKAYAKKFVDSWIEGYKGRMLLLSTATVVNHFKALDKIDMSYAIATDGAAGHTYATITNSTGFDQTISLINETVSRRLPHAVDGVVSPD